ncbi:MAG TPA: class I SAM-dependent RNA methyltransferase [Pyrinomonadaceae bacterium]
MEVTIERILPGGLGLAHAEGKTLMVALAAPGDRLRVHVDRVKGNVCFASIVEVLEPSPVRIAPPCPYFGRCGGCDFQQLTYEAQLSAKAEIIKDCLHRIGRINTVPDFNIAPAPNQWRYRSRAQWQYDSVRQRLGYFESVSRNVCDVSECAVLVPELQQSLETLRHEMGEGLLPNDARYFRAVVGDQGVSVSSGVRSPSISEGKIRDISRSVNGETYNLNAESFFQTNIDLAPQLIEAAIGGASGDAAIELYSGVGLFTLPLARRFKHVIAVEENPDAASFAQENLANAGLTNVDIANAAVGQWLNGEVGGLRSEKRRQAAALQIDFLLLDPPRVGAESRVIDGILQLSPKQICYVSCDPATLARDLRKIIAGGYSLDSLSAFDMFPQTHHVETIAKLTGP